MKRPTEADYTSQVAYTRALEEYCDGLEQPAEVPSKYLYLVDVTRWTKGENIKYDPPIYFTNELDANKYCWAIHQDKAKSELITVECSPVKRTAPNATQTTKNSS
jgi:hypothetical protein